jgi:pyrroline-5-carboxylate reductase
MKKLGFIGGGNMAEALIRGLLGRRVFTPADLVASDIDRGRRQRLKRIFKIEVADDNSEVLRDARALLIAVKPQNIGDALAQLKAGFELAASARSTLHPRRTLARPRGQARGTGAVNERLFISIAAGITLARLSDGLGPRARVIRVMPNAPAMVGEGMAAIVRGKGATRADELLAIRIFGAVGDAVVLKNEAMLDAVTALSGSGPAYVYLFTKAMADAGVAEGLPADLALRMALKTIRGAETNMRQSNLDAGELIRIVASPGGTTEAALQKFDQSRFSDIVAEAVHAAAQRSRQLGG